MRINSMKLASMMVGLVAAIALVGGCKSSGEPDVKTNKLSQWTTVAANTADTTAAAEAVLKDEGLKDVSGSSTNVDGKAMAKKADGTEVKVSVEKKSDKISEVTVKVGSMGDSDLGAHLARKIKERAEMMK